jgi:hypothetical protein
MLKYTPRQFLINVVCLKSSFRYKHLVFKFTIVVSLTCTVVLSATTKARSRLR